MLRLEPTLCSLQEIAFEAEVATLRMLDGRRAGRVYVLEQRDTLLGAQPDCTIRIREEGIGPRHALVHSVEGRQPVIADLTGDGGTRVNGAVIQDAPLYDGDIVILGTRVVVRFEYRDVIRYRDGSPITGVRVRSSVFAQLPRSERGVASLFARGHGDYEIAEGLDLELADVRERIAALRARLGACNRVDLIRRLIEGPKRN